MDFDLEFFLWIVFGIVMICLLIRTLPPPGTEYTGKREKNWCPPHKWIKKNGKRRCEECEYCPEEHL